MTDQGPSETRTELDARGERVEIRWELLPPRRWWQSWKGNVHSRTLPSDTHVGTFWTEDLEPTRARSRKALERKLKHREEAILGFAQRPSLWTDGNDVWPG